MKDRRVKTTTICAVMVLGICIPTGISRGQAKNQKAAMDAYNLRMQGKVDDARALLEQDIQKNPHNAAAYYELARTRLYMALGNPKNLEEGITDADQSISKAVENEPNNVIYPFFEGYVAFFQAYISLMKNESDAKEKVSKVCEAYESALKLKPDYCQAMLYLVEIYGALPEDKGGDKSKAEQYAKKLEGLDEVLGAKARSILLPEDANSIDYWQNVLKKNEGNADVLEELGKAYLRADKANEGVLCFEKAVKINPEKAYLFLDLSRYYTFSAMRAGNDTELLNTSMTSGDAAVTRYLESKPILSMQAHALGVQYKFKYRLAGKEEAEKILKRAEALDPYFSKATGAPHPDLFILPDEISKNHRYLFRPF